MSGLVSALRSITTDEHGWTQINPDPCASVSIRGQKNLCPLSTRVCRRTPKLSDAGGPKRPNRQATWPARIRSSDLVRQIQRVGENSDETSACYFLTAIAHQNVSRKVHGPDSKSVGI